MYINGAQADQAVSQLQTSNMEISRSENGRLSVDLHGKNRSDLTKEERLVYDAIMSSDVKINITAQNTELQDGKHIFRATINGEKTCTNVRMAVQTWGPITIQIAIPRHLLVLLTWMCLRQMVLIRAWLTKCRNT